MFYAKVIKNGKVPPGLLGGIKRSYKNRINGSLKLLQGNILCEKIMEHYLTDHILRREV